MATPKRRLAANAPGDFFVDETCIDCDACRWIASNVFDQQDEQSRVYRQPETETDRVAALKALLACPTASIGMTQRHPLGPIREMFPDPIEDGVYHCGYHSKKSFGATTYFIQRDGGNVLVDSPRFTKQLVSRIEALGGVQTLFLTHKDDVADHAKWRDHFGCDRILHAGDYSPNMGELERILEGDDPIRLDDELLILPTPGHTEGSCCLLYRDKFLFSGDHVAWSYRLGHVYAFRSACWYDWGALTDSMERLAAYPFEWILPGHARRCRFSQPEMAQQMRNCVEWMKRSRES